MIMATSLLYLLVRLKRCLFVLPEKVFLTSLCHPVIDKPIQIFRFTIGLKCVMINANVNVNHVPVSTGVLVHPHWPPRRIIKEHAYDILTWNLDRY